MERYGAGNPLTSLIRVISFHLWLVKISATDFTDHVYLIVLAFAGLVARFQPDRNKLKKVHDLFRSAYAVDEKKWFSELWLPPLFLRLLRTKSPSGSRNLYNRFEPS